MSNCCVYILRFIVTKILIQYLVYESYRYFFYKKIALSHNVLIVYREFWNFNTYMNFYVWITVCLKNAMYICYDHTDRHRLFWMPRVGQLTPKQDKLSSWLTTHPPLRSEVIPRLQTNAYSSTRKETIFSFNAYSFNIFIDSFKFYWFLWDG